MRLALRLTDARGRTELARTITLPTAARGRILPLGRRPPGRYRLDLTLTDRAGNPRALSPVRRGALTAVPLDTALGRVGDSGGHDQLDPKEGHAAGPCRQERSAGQGVDGQPTNVDDVRLEVEAARAGLDEDDKDHARLGTWLEDLDVVSGGGVPGKF